MSNIHGQKFRDKRLAQRYAANSPWPSKEPLFAILRGAKVRGDCGDSGHQALYDRAGGKMALLFDEGLIGALRDLEPRDPFSAEPFPDEPVAGGDTQI